MEYKQESECEEQESNKANDYDEEESKHKEK